MHKKLIEQYENTYFKSTIYRNAGEIIEITRPLQLLNITYFCYLELNDKNEVACLINHDTLPLHYIRNDSFALDPAFTSQTAKPEIYSHSQLSHRMKTGCLDKYKFTLDATNTNDGYIFFVPERGVRKTYHFGIKDCNFNRPDLLEKFAYYFNEKARALISKSDRILLPPSAVNLEVSTINTIEKCYEKKHLKINKFLQEINFTRHQCINFAKLYGLSKREIDCLLLVIEGKIAKQISYILGLKLRTVESYLENIKLKTNCRTKMDLIIKVFTERF
jgi:DNA-binding CsgD family transcriptional regulator